MTTAQLNAVQDIREAATRLQHAAHLIDQARRATLPARKAKMARQAREVLGTLPTIGIDLRGETSATSKALVATLESLHSATLAAGAEWGAIAKATEGA